MEDITMAKNKNHNLFKRGDVWYFRRRKNGKWIKKGLSRNLTEARDLRDKYYKEMLVYGRIQKEEAPDIPLFGFLAQKWFNLKWSMPMI